MIRALKMTALRMALLGWQSHDIERRDRGESRHQHRRDDGEIFRDVVGDAESRQRTAGHQHLLPDLDDLDQLGRIAVEVDHVARFARGLGAGVHRHADVGLRERGRVVGAVTGHRDEMTFGLFLADAT